MGERRKDARDACSSVCSSGVRSCGCVRMRVRVVCRRRALCACTTTIEFRSSGRKVVEMSAENIKTVVSVFFLCVFSPACMHCARDGSKFSELWRMRCAGVCRGAGARMRALGAWLDVCLWGCSGGGGKSLREQLEPFPVFGFLLTLVQGCHCWQICCAGAP